MIDRLTVFGATGDLAARYLFPALASLHAAGRLPDGFRIVASARDDDDTDGFRRRLGEALHIHAADVSADARDAIVASTRYAAADVGSATDVRQAIGDEGEAGAPNAAYLALPPSTFPTALRTLADLRLPEGSRVAVEKPFGSSLDEARALNALIGELFGLAAERIVYRVDHALGMATTQRLIGLRATSLALDRLWHGEAIESVEILWEEVLGLEGRAGYFDHAGALKDVMQNHMLQVLAVVAMEPPASLDERDLRDAKVAALRAVRSPAADRMAENTRRGRYGAGTLPPSPGHDARIVPAYADEAGVDPARETETLAELTVEIDTPRWSGTRFVLRGGKALAARRKGVLVRFRRRPGVTGRPEPETLWIGIDGPDDLRMDWTGVSLQGPPPSADLPPYGNVLADFLAGDSRLSVRGDEAEEAWRIVTPVLDAWRAGRVPLEEYPAGAPGFADRD